MRALAFALPSFLLSQVPIASAWTVPIPTYDAEHNKLGAVASQSEVCSDIGIKVLKAGGNAADSLVATTLCVGVIGMHHSGIGGGGFMLVRSSNGTYEYIDFRETAPAAAFEDMYKNNSDASLTGGLASGVPGELRGLSHLHTNYGSLPWKDLVLPAVHVARDGFPVTADLVRYMDSATSSNNFLLEPSWAIDFAPNGTRVGLGDIMTRKRYAATLETIAEHGAEAFYAGPIAETTINALQAANGTMTLQDLANYTVAIRDPVNITYRGYKIHGCSAPSSGAVGLSIMKIIEGYPTIGQAAAVNESTHILTEALRFAYGQRTILGDPSFVDNMDAYQASMLSNATVDAVRAKINPAHTWNTSVYDPAGFESLETPGTSAIVASDFSGLSIALTTTINTLFGSKVLVPETGIIMNNEMNDFSIPGTSNAFGFIPSPANYVRPGKRPLSSITPTIVENADGTVYFVAAGAGGSRIITSTVQQLWYVLDQNATAAEALAKPRLHDQLIPNVVEVEWTYDNATTEYLTERGHNVTWIRRAASSSQQLRRLANGTFEAAGEPRQLSSAGRVA